MGARRVDTQVAEADIEGQQQPLVRTTRFDDEGVRTADEPFIGDCVDFVAVLCQQRCSRARYVLVELDLHEPAGRPWISCLASQAP